MTEPYLGEVRIFAGNFAPRAWAYCDGQIIAISQNDSLFSLLGTIYGGDGRTTFGLPDFRGRLVGGMGSGAGLTPRPLGQRMGDESITLTLNQIPQHNHPFQATNATGSQLSPQGHVPASPGTGSVFYEAHGTADNLRTLHADSIQNTGGDQPHTNLMPALALHYIIALAGVYPSRT